MSETVNVGEIAEKLSVDIFSSFFWQMKGKWNENFDCHCPSHLGSDDKPKTKHPGDAIFYYEDPYLGSTIYLRGFERAGKRYWAQTNSRYGQLTFFTGIASDGEAWVGYNRRVGWTTINRFSSSGGSSARFTCSRITGC